jgi:hypothetical protein
VQERRLRSVLTCGDACLQAPPQLAVDPMDIETKGGGGQGGYANDRVAANVGAADTRVDSRGRVARERT